MNYKIVFFKKKFQGWAKMLSSRCSVLLSPPSVFIVYYTGLFNLANDFIRSRSLTQSTGTARFEVLPPPSPNFFIDRDSRS